MKKVSQQSANNTSLIARGMEFHGDLHFSGILEIEGVIVGNIIAHDDVVAEVRIREAGVVKGLVRAPVVIVNGVVEGDIYSSNHIELAAKARITGNMYYHLMEMVLGCVVHGQLVHKASAEIIQMTRQSHSRETDDMREAGRTGTLNRH